MGHLTTLEAPRLQRVLRRPPLCRAGSHCPLPRSPAARPTGHPAAPTWKGAAYWQKCPWGTRSTVGELGVPGRSGCPRERRLAVSPGETLPRSSIPHRQKRIGVSRRLLSQVNEQCLSCWALIGQVGQGLLRTCPL